MKSYLSHLIRHCGSAARQIWINNNKKKNKSQKHRKPMWMNCFAHRWINKFNDRKESNDNNRPCWFHSFKLNVILQEKERKRERNKKKIKTEMLRIQNNMMSFLHRKKKSTCKWPITVTVVSFFFLCAFIHFKFLKNKKNTNFNEIEYDWNFDLYVAIKHR